MCVLGWVLLKSIVTLSLSLHSTVEAVAYREEGVWGVQTPPPEIPKALQHCAKLNPICENC